MVFVVWHCRPSLKEHLYAGLQVLFIIIFLLFYNERLIAASTAQGGMRAFQVLVLIYSHYLGHSYYCTRGELCTDSQLSSQHAGLPEKETVFSISVRSVVACSALLGLIPNVLYRGLNVSIMITNEIYESAGDIHKGAAAACAGVGREEQQDDTFGPSPGHSCQAPPPPQGKWC